MKSSIFLLSNVLWVFSLWGQGTVPPATSSSQTGGQTPSGTAANSNQLTPRGPESVAKQDPNRVVATINGQQLTAQQAENLLKEVPADQRRNVPNLENLLERVYMIQQFANQADKLNLQQQEPWKNEIQFSRENILAQAYVQRLTTEPGSASDAAKQYYDTHQSEFEQSKISGILVSFAPPGTPANAGATTRTEQQARQKADDLEKKLKAGTDFATLARTESDNTQLAARGGDLGTLTADTPNVPADLKATVLKLQPGQVSEPIRLPNGFYIIKVDSRTLEPFDKARAGIVLKQEFEKYKIEVKDPAFFSASSGSPSGYHIPSLQRPGGGPISPSPQSPATAPKPPAR